MSDFNKIFDNYEPRKSCKGCVHYENGDWDTDRCLKIECESRCDDEQICVNDLEYFYQQGRADAVSDCIYVMKMCWYNGQQPLNVLIERLEQLKEQNDE